MDNILWIDIESTDLPIHTARIVTISFLFNGKERTLFINPMVPISPGASKVNGIYDKDVVSWKPLKEYAPQIMTILENCDAYGGYNCRTFDIGLLTVEMLRCGYNIPVKPIFDVYEMVQGLFKSLKLSDIYRTLINKELDAHKSIEDVKATKELYEFIQAKYYKV